jgi:SAM-dependent methyltransferase
MGSLRPKAEPVSFPGFVMPDQAVHSYPPGDNFSLYDGPVIRDGLCRRGITSVMGFPLKFEVEDIEDVLFPTDFGLALLRTVRECAFEMDGRVLDVGCGAGNFVCAFAKHGAREVVGIDSWRSCVEMSRHNCRQNGLTDDKVVLLPHSIEAYKPDRPFDLVVSNPPHLPDILLERPRRGIDVAALGGEDGRVLYDAILDSLDRLLCPGGVLLLAHSSLADTPRTMMRLTQMGYMAEILQSHEMDLPLLAYRDYASLLFDRLKELKSKGAAEFDGDRFQVHIVAARRK